MFGLEHLLVISLLCRFLFAVFCVELSKQTEIRSEWCECELLPWLCEEWSCLVQRMIPVLRDSLDLSERYLTVWGKHIMWYAVGHL